MLAIMKVFGLSLPGMILSTLTLGVWSWGPKYTFFAVSFLYIVIYFVYWFLTDFYDNCL